VLEKKYQKNEIIFQPGQNTYSLYKIISGKVLTLMVQGSRVTPIFMNTPGSYVGSTLFFLNQDVKTYAVAVEDASVIIYDQKDLNENFPPWLKSMASSLARKTYDQINQMVERGIKKSYQGVTPLSIEEQRRYLQILKLI
jgi:CRP-like cAMP-binding protein